MRPFSPPCLICAGLPCSLFAHMSSNFLRTPFFLHKNTLQLFSSSHQHHGVETAAPERHQLCFLCQINCLFTQPRRPEMLVNTGIPQLCHWSGAAAHSQLAGRILGCSAPSQLSPWDGCTHSLCLGLPRILTFTESLMLQCLV